MSNPIIYDDLSIRTAYPEIYQEFVEKKKIFKKKIHLFTTALAIGVITETSSKETPNHDLIRFSTVVDEKQKKMINILARLSCNEPDKKERGKQLQLFADGGLKKLWDDYQESGILDTPRIIEEIKGKCLERKNKILEGVL